MKRDLTDQVIVITGASSGIGAATAKAAADAGMDVVLAARREEKLRAVAERVEAAGRAALVVPTDVADDEAVAALVEEAVGRFDRLDVMMANAGYGYEAALADESPEEHRRIFEVNYFGTLRSIRAALPIMRDAGRGHILITSSILGRLGLPAYSAYCATKAAQQVMGQSLRAELAAENIDVSVVFPIGTKTEFFEKSAQRTGSDQLSDHTPEWMMQRPEQVARAVIGCLRKPRPEVWPAFGSHLLSALAVMAPRITAWAMRRMYQDMRRNG